MIALFTYENVAFFVVRLVDVIYILTEKSTGYKQLPKVLLSPIAINK